MKEYKTADGKEGIALNFKAPKDPYKARLDTCFAHFNSDSESALMRRAVDMLFDSIQPKSHDLTGAAHAGFDSLFYGDRENLRIMMRTLQTANTLTYCTRHISNMRAFGAIEMLQARVDHNLPTCIVVPDPRGDEPNPEREYAWLISSLMRGRRIRVAGDRVEPEIAVIAARKSYDAGFYFTDRELFIPFLMLGDQTPLWTKWTAGGSLHSIIEKYADAVISDAMGRSNWNLLEPLKEYEPDSPELLLSRPKSTRRKHPR